MRIGTGIHITDVHPLLASEEDVIALLSNSIVRHYPFTVLPASLQSSTGSTGVIGSPGLLISAGGGANRATARKIEGHADDETIHDRLGNNWKFYLTEWFMHMGPWRVPPAGDSATRLAGMAVGWPGSMSSGVNDPADAMFQLRFNFLANLWELYSAPGDSEPDTVVQFPSGATQTEGDMSLCRVRYDPYTPKLEAWVNGHKVEITDTDFLPKLAAFDGSGVMLAVFAANGTSADAGHSTQLMVTAPWVITHDIYSRAPATLWY
jgi:hypothetical protein